MRLPLQLLAIPITVFMLSSCKKKCTPLANKQVTNTVTPGSFNAIEVSFPATVNLTQTNTEAVQVICDSALQSRVKARIYGNTLKLEFDKENLCATAPVTINLSIKNLELITASGQPVINTVAPLKLDKIKLDFAGNIKGNLQLIAQSLTGVLRGADSVTLAGQASSCTLNLNGNVAVTAHDFAVSDYDINAVGENSASIAVLSNLKLNTTGKNKITYKGNPKTFKQSKDGLLELKEYR